MSELLLSKLRNDAYQGHRNRLNRHASWLTITGQPCVSVSKGLAFGTSEFCLGKFHSGAHALLYRVLQPLKDSNGLLLCIFVKFSQNGRQLLDRIMNVTIFILALVTHALEPIQNLNFT